MSEKSSSASVSTFGLLGIAFVVLKLTGFIDWSWWYVTMPFWGGAAIVVVVLLAYMAWTLAVTWLYRRRIARSRSKS